MKKVLSFILVLSMVLGSFGMAFAAPAAGSDIAGHQNEKAILRLNKLGIVKGDDRGFAPDANITRAEFAVLVVRALGLEGSANVAKGETQFTDVTMTNGYDWATGAINVATRLGYIQGYGNGKFGPGDNIKYEDAITLLVRILGYEPAAQEKGGYPVGYLVVAEQDIDMTDHVKGTTGEAATRGAVFQLLDNSLTKPLMIQTGYGDEKKYVVSGQKGTGTEKQTILTNKLGIDEIEGRVTANFRVNSRLKANEIEITTVEDKKATTEKYKVSEDLDVDALLGLEVTAWEDKDDVLFRYEVDTDEEDVMYDTVAKDGATEKEVKLVVADDEFEWAEDAKVYVNNKKVSAKDFDEIKDNVYGRVVLDEYGDVAFAYFFEFDAKMQGMSLKVKDDEIEFVSIYAQDEDLIELDEAEKVYVFNTDFSTASLKDIKEGTAVFGWVDGDDNYYIVIKNEVVEGKLESVRVRDGRLTINGKNISKAPLAIYSDNEGKEYSEWLTSGDSATTKNIEEFVDEEIKVILDLAGKALVLTTDVNVTSNTVYGVATYLTEGRNPVLTVFTNEGKEVEYKFEDREDAKKISKLDLDFLGDKGDPEFAAVSFKLNKDGEIAKGQLNEAIKSDAFEALTKNSDDKYVSLSDGKRYIRENTVIIKAFNNNKDNKKVLKPSLIKYDDIINREIKDNNSAIVIGNAGRNADLIVFVNPAFEAKDDTQYGVVTGDVRRVGGDYKVEIDVAGKGKADYVVGSRTDVTKGELIAFTLNNKGEAKTVTSTVYKETVLDKDDSYLSFTKDSWKLVDKDTVIYQLDKDGKLDGTTRLSRISKGDKVSYVEKDGVLKALIVTTKYTGETGNGGTTPEGTVTGEVYADYDASQTKIKFVVVDKDGKEQTTTEYEITKDTIFVDYEGNIVESIRENTLQVRRALEAVKGKKLEIVLTKEKTVDSVYQIQK